MDYIATHEHVFPAPFLQFYSWNWREHQPSALPGIAGAKGTVDAYVNHGRWIAECPDGCGHAVIASDREPFYICTRCGNEANDGQWLNVKFPRQRKSIEAELVRRAARHPHKDAPTRNWKPGETVAELRSERQLRGE